MDGPSAALAAHDLHAGYGEIDVLHGIDLHVDAGEVVALLGANGAGKTTTLRAFAGLLPARGRLDVLGHRDRAPLHVRTRRGMCYLPDDRGIVRSLSVADNLRLAGVKREDAYELSPELEALAGRRAGHLSGGEQQILALTGAIARNPALLMADELSFGLAPVVVARMLRLARLAAERGAAVLLVEQYASQALAAADRAYVLQRGRVAIQGPAADLAGDTDAIERSYLGTAG